MISAVRQPLCCGVLLLLLLAVPGHTSSPAHVYRGLKVSAYKEITAYILNNAQQQLAPGFNLDVSYVTNAEEAHSDLKTGKADVVFMSYDDTLSIFFQETFSDILAVWPEHGGILSLCGAVDTAQNRTRVGIDTDSGYARALRLYLKQTMSVADYERITWVYAGATNIRYQKLAAGELDATLLNPPFTSMLAQGIPCQPLYALIGPYQGVVANVRKSWQRSPINKKNLLTFYGAYRCVMADMKMYPAKTIFSLASFYNITAATATAVYASLWQPDGLNAASCFNVAQLNGTEYIFSQDTGIRIPRGPRVWVEKQSYCSKTGAPGHWNMHGVLKC